MTQIYAPGTRIGPYEIASRPLMGGMGVVYFAVDHGNDGRPVALKTFRPELLPDRAARDRFLREGTAWVELGRHPHIVRCHQVMYIDPTAFLVLELVAKDEGREDASLRSWLGKPLPLETALAFTLQIAHGMQHATQQLPGFVHRDLKPENVLVGSDKLPGTDINRLRVTDFGLATLLKDENGKMKDEDGPESVGRTHLTHGIVGTPLYMAPEQWQGEPVGVYTDVYALGCILYEMLAGERVVSGRSLADLQAAHCAGRLRSLPTGLPGDVADFLARSLAREGHARYPDWEAVLSALEAACAGRRLSLAAWQTEAASLAERCDLASSYLEIGTSYLDIGNARVAASYYEKALSLFREIGYRTEEGMALGNLGNAYLNLGDARRAIGYYEEALKIDRAIGDRRGEGADLGNLGNAYLNLGDARRAIEYYEAQLVITRAIGDRRREGNALGNLGNAYADLGDARRAIGYYEERLVIAREIGDRRGEGAVLGSLGTVYAELSDARRAIGFYEEDLKIAREIGNRQGEGAVLGNLGLAYADLGNARRAIGFYEEGLKIDREIGDRHGEGKVLGNLGSAYYSLGDARRAIGYYEERLVIAREIGDRRGEGNALSGLGNAYATLGDARRAIGYYEAQLVITRAIGDRRGEGMALGNLGTAYADLGDAQRAIRFFEESLIIKRAIGDRRGEGNTLGNLGVALADLGDARRAIEFYEAQLAIVREVGDRRGEGNALGNLGVVYAELGDARRASGYYEEALATWREIGDIDGVASASFNMALLYAKQGETAHAVPLAQEAERIWTQIGSPNAQRARELLAELQGGGAAPVPDNPAQAAFEAFQCAGSAQEMQAAVEQYMLMKEAGFIQAIEQTIREQVPANLKPAFEQRLAWLKQIAGKQSGFFDRLLGKKG